jgi:hypothetical protein
MGFVFIEANVKKWGLAPMTGSLAPPPPYGSEQGSILLEGGREGVREGMGGYVAAGFHNFPSHGRSHSHQVRLGSRQPTSPGPQRSPTDISLAQLSLVDSHEGEDVGEGTSNTPIGLGFDPSHGVGGDAPPDYESPTSSESSSEPRLTDNTPLLHSRNLDPPIPTYDAAVAESRSASSSARGRERSSTR